MPKIIPILLILSFLFSCKEKEPQSNQAVLEIDPNLEEYGFSCDTINYKETRDVCLWQKNSFEKIRAMYEDSLKRIAPKCKECKECNINERLEKLFGCQKILELALKIGTPYPTIEEKIEEDEKMKSAFKEKFGVPIADFELSIIGVHYSMSIIKLLAIRTATGASGKALIYRSRGERAYDKEIGDINMDDWLDFIWTLQKLEISKWKKEYTYEKYQLTHTDKAVGNWSIIIYYLDKDGYIEKFESFGTSYREITNKNYPPNFAKVTEAVEKFRTKIIESMIMKFAKKNRKASESVENSK